MVGAGELQPLEQGDPGGDSRAFRRALGHFATGVTVVTAQSEGRLVALTANSFSSVSLDPPLVLWSIDRASRNLPVFREAAHFAINVLTSDQIALATRFARSGDDKFAGLPWRPGRGGAPLLPDVAATFECRSEIQHEAGDHVVMIGRVERFARYNQPLLLFSQGRFGRAVDHPDLVRTDAPDAKAAAAAGRETMLTLLRKAYGRLSGDFQRHRNAEGLSVNQGRALTHLEQHSTSSLEAVARHCFLGLEDAEEAVAALISRGYAVRGSDGVVGVSPEGRERLNAIREQALAFEAERFGTLPESDLDAARRVLQSLARDLTPGDQ